MNDSDRYPADVLAGDWRSQGRVKPIEVPVARGLILERADTGWTGEVVRLQAGIIEFEGRGGVRRAFPLGDGFLYEGAPAIAVPPRAVAAATTPRRTASGSIAAPTERARTARLSRIFVEGRHDAELVEKVWGDDLRAEGVVVEYLGGIDDLPAIIAEFGPEKGRRIGVLVDHLVTGSKESRIAAEVARGPFGAHVLVVGHPYIDIWQAVRPERLGAEAWPVIPRGQDWKTGVCRAFGWPHATTADTGRAWQHILSRVRNYLDLEPALLGRVEHLIDFVTEPGA